MEIVRNRYLRLIDVRLLHHYWLDDGRTPFDQMDDAARRTRLLGYDSRQLFTVSPSSVTRDLIAGSKGFFKSTGQGFVVAVPQTAVFSTGVSFEFRVSATEPGYSQYTSLSLRDRLPVESIEPGAHPVTFAPNIRRYRPNVPVLSNGTGSIRQLDGMRRFFLSREYSKGIDAADGVESLVTSDDDLIQIIGDPKETEFISLGESADHPVYVHQGDVPAIVPPLGTTGAPPRGIAETDDMPRVVEAVIRIAARRADDARFDIVGPDGRPRDPSPVFEVHFRNRWATARGRSSTTGEVLSIAVEPAPLTNAVSDREAPRLPSSTVVVERDQANPALIDRLISEIYALPALPKEPQ